jgi:hypothetical protein
MKYRSEVILICISLITGDVEPLDPGLFYYGRVFITISYHSLLFCLNFVFLHDSVLVESMCQLIYPLLLGYLICCYVVANNDLIILFYSQISCHVSLFISNFIYLSLLSFFKLYSMVIGYSFLPMSVDSIWSTMLFMSNVSLLIFYLIDLSMAESKLFKPLNIL